MNTILTTFGTVISSCTLWLHENIFIKKNKENKTNYFPESATVYNLTPHNINLYNNEKKFLLSIKPEDPKMQLRLSTADENIETKKLKMICNNYVSNTVMTDNSVLTSYDDWLGGHYAETQISVKRPIEYSKIDGVEEFKKFIKFDSYKRDIIVSTIVAEFLIKNKSKYKDVTNGVYVPDTNPQNVIRDEKGTIMGVTGLIYYGTLQE